VNRRILILGILAMVIVGAAVAFGIAGSGADNEAGLGIPTENLVERSPAGAAPIAGTVWVAGNGCFHLDAHDGARYFIVWPEGFRQDSAEVVAPGGGRYGDGDSLSGTGWIRAADEVVAAADGPDGYMGAIVGFCADDEQIAVLLTH
jgi:hypothetical protein